MVRRAPHRRKAKAKERTRPPLLPNRQLTNMPPFKDEHILLIAPGSQMTLAQLGLPESFTPARFRFPTRMFPAEKKGEFEPYKVRQRQREFKVNNVTNGSTEAPKEAPKETPKEDVEMKDGAETAAPQNGDANGNSAEKTDKPEGETATEGEEKTVQEFYYEEDVTSEEGAVYPIENGRIVDWPCFFALLTHIYNSLSPPFHTPILLVAQPVWSARDRETITQFIFEKFKVPGFSMMDAALAAAYGFGVQTATVVDVGKGKVDVTAITDYAVNEHGRGIALEGCGGDAMTDRLVELLGSKGFSREMCEQLKRSNIAEILPPGTTVPGTAATARQGVDPAAGAEGDKAAPGGPGAGAQTGGDTNGEEEEGVLDVAAIVSGDTNEYLANMEKEKGNKKGGVDPKQPRLPNSKKEKASFQFEEFVRMEGENTTGGPQRYTRHSREIEVGVERFFLATPRQKVGDRLTNGILEDIATQIHHTILAVPDATKRSELWDSLIIVGCGSRVRGFIQSLLGVITQKFILSPSATIFTSEIPSAFTTPLPTGGTNTPAPMSQPPGPMYHPAAHGVNPLLVAATHNNPGMPIAPGTPGMDPSFPTHHRSTGHSQTPTSVKTLRLPEYFPDFKDQGNTNAPGTTTGHTAATSGHGSEEGAFLGAQMGAKVFFVLDQGITKGYMSRVEYNESGPSAIHEYSL
ncbi:hypothetical protein N7478_011899 [Penicillium angulare]|uniref:uncharacterized protein n=1 Tax=Penicillium angulare TaxID=116970 RepID=UPI00253F75E3|nr:uncharacterized protein N7478_011899 [Penicillium angulare]KAJ5261304.1 hypothetical protein N7478_011899 [Penicillium angulare]